MIVNINSYLNSIVSILGERQAIRRSRCHRVKFFDPVLISCRICPTHRLAGQDGPLLCSRWLPMRIRFLSDDIAYVPMQWAWMNPTLVAVSIAVSVLTAMLALGLAGAALARPLPPPVTGCGHCQPGRGRAGRCTLSACRRSRPAAPAALHCCTARCLCCQACWPQALCCTPSRAPRCAAGMCC